MLRAPLIRLLTVLMLVVVTQGAEAQVPIDAMTRSTVRIFCQSDEGIGMGTGFVVGDEHVATNLHVVDCARSGGDLVVGLNPDSTFDARIVWSSATIDLAVVRVANPLNRPVVRLVPSTFVRPDDDVRAIGFPSAADGGAWQGQGGRRYSDALFVPSITRGIISRAITDENQVRLFQTDAAINPGNSGGPLFNTCGEVLGINVEKSLTEVRDARGARQRVTLGEGIGWAIRADELIETMGRLSLPVTPASARCTGAMQALATPPGPSANGSGGVSGWLLLLGALIVGALVFAGARMRKGGAPEVASRPVAAPSPPPLRAGPPRLVMAGGVLAGQEARFEGRTLTLGRDARVCALVFPPTATEVSKRHAALYWDDAQRVAYLRDLDSTNGTFLANGTRLAEGTSVPLRPGERFYLGVPANVCVVQA